MIIVMKQTELNKRCAEIIAKYYKMNNNAICYYPMHYFSQSHYSEKGPLFVIDLDADNTFQNTINPQLFAIRLNLRKITAHIKDIYILVSDTNENKKLPPFASSFAKALSKDEKREIGVHIPTSLTYNVTLIIPPTDKENWRIYGVYKEDMPKNKETVLNSWENIKNKSLLWEGEDILSWLNDSQNTYYGTSYAWSK